MADKDTARISSTMPAPKSEAIPQDTEKNGCSNAPYSGFNNSQRKQIALLVAFAAMFSPLSSFIYYPCIDSIAKDLGVTVELINLTITSYMIVSAIAPAIVGDFADILGRRPIYMITFTIYFAANVGLATQRSYPVLLVLRMLQSAGSSGTTTIAYGVISDIASPAERGSYVGAVLCGPNLAPSLGPVLGGVLAGRLGWPWVFWFLVVLSSFCLSTLLMFLPETSRGIVGNGSIPARGINRSFHSLFYHNRSPVASTDIPASRPIRFPSPLKSLYTLSEKDTMLIVLVNGIFYMTYGCIQASLSSLFIDIYGFEELEAGLIYLPFGFGCLMASFISGKIMDRDYRVTAKAYGITIEKVKGDDLAEFQIERARFRSSGYLITLAIATIIGYGWALDTKVHVAVPLILQFFIGASITGVSNICGTLLTDIHPQNPATAQASSNIVRCALSASGFAALQEMIAHIGPGWTFTVFAALCLATIPMIVAEIRWGLQWRQARNTVKETQIREQQGLQTVQNPAVLHEVLEDHRLMPTRQ